MGDSRSPSGLTPFAPPSPMAVSHSYTPPLTTVDIIFDKPMDQTVLPALTSFELVIDGTPQTPATRVWQDAVTLAFTWAVPPPATGVWNQIAVDTNLRGLDQSLVKLPQTQDFHP